MSSVGFFCMKCSHILMNVSVVSTVGHSPWLHKKETWFTAHKDTNVFNSKEHSMITQRMPYLYSRGFCEQVSQCFFFIIILLQVVLGMVWLMTETLMDLYVCWKAWRLYSSFKIDTGEVMYFIISPSKSEVIPSSICDRFGGTIWQRGESKQTI